MVPSSLTCCLHVNVATEQITKRISESKIGLFTFSLCPNVTLCETIHICDHSAKLKWFNISNSIILVLFVSFSLFHYPMTVILYELNVYFIVLI